MPSVPSPKQVGIFGGTFDPVHLGHLIMAEQCREQARLDQLWFLPAGRPPHKQGQPVTPFARRVEMLNLAVAGYPAFRVEEVEGEKADLNYTFETLEELGRRYPAAEWHFVIGSDSLPDLPHWRKPARILELASLLVVARPGSPVLGAGELRASLGLPDEAPLHLQVVEVPLIEISSRDLRRRVADGRSIRYQVPRAVECYIESHKLYRT
jgi:nicotinate-nucleotide adenylyltransferase